MPLPPKRSLDVFPIEQDGEPFFVMRDPEGILEQPVALRVVAALIWDLLDGERDALDIQEFIARHGQGALIPSEQIDQLVRQLDEIYLLDSPRLARRRDDIKKEFAALDRRPPRFTGDGGYPHEAEALAGRLEEYYKGEFGAGVPGKLDGNGTLRAVVSPHIDFGRGGACYTHAYRRIAEAPRADLYVILGVAHCSPDPPFVPTVKDYETPFGAAPVDRAFVESLLRKTKRDGLEEEVVHRTEHSIEFQAVFLQHALRDQPGFTVAPILCSSFEPHCGAKSPSTAPRVEEYIGALGETIRECGRRVCLIAGVDLAHVGPRFGDKEAVDDKAIKRMMEGDKGSLAALANGDAEGFWGSVMGEGNRRKVCGLSALYTTLRLLGGGKGELLRYTYAPDPAGGIVSFAAAAFR